jgi:hypothetical protein
MKGKKERELCGTEAKLAHVVRCVRDGGEMAAKGSIVTVLAHSNQAVESNSTRVSHSVHDFGELDVWKAISGSKCRGTPTVLAILRTERGPVVVLSGNCLCK